MSEGLSEICVRRESERFRDYWLGLGGAKAAKLDWLATWRNWVRKALDDRRKPAVNSNANPRPGDKRISRDGREQEYGGYGVGWLTCQN